MPNTRIKISDAIIRLQWLMREHGDLEMTIDKTGRTDYLTDFAVEEFILDDGTKTYFCFPY